MQRRYITQDPIGLRGGWNPYTYPLNPVTNIDPLGLAETSESYVVSGDLAALGDEARSRWNPLTHTFTVTTDGQGNILHTYSWGNNANLKGWNLDQSIDLKKAREVLDDGLAQPTLAPSNCVKEAYDELNKKKMSILIYSLRGIVSRKLINCYSKRWLFVLLINGVYLHFHRTRNVWILILTMRDFFVVLLTGIATSIVAIVFYSVFIILWGKGTCFGYVRLFFTSSIICGGMLGAYFTHVNNNGVANIIYGIITSLIIFFLIGLAIVNVYGT